MGPNNSVCILEMQNNRVLRYPRASTTATRVLGQPSMATTQAGVGVNALSMPRGLAADVAGNLYMVDFANNRALRFPAILA